MFSILVDLRKIRKHKLLIIIFLTKILFNFLFIREWINQTQKENGAIQVTSHCFSVLDGSLVELRLCNIVLLWNTVLETLSNPTPTPTLTPTPTPTPETAKKIWKQSSQMFYPVASKASREVANLTVRKNPHTSVYGVKECVCLSVANFDPNYLGTGRTELTEIFLGHRSFI